MSLQSRNPFLLLKHLDFLAPEQIHQLSSDIENHVNILYQGLLDDKFSGEQISEMRFWIAGMLKQLECLSLSKGCWDIIKELSGSQ